MNENANIISIIQCHSAAFTSLPTVHLSCRDPVYLHDPIPKTQQQSFLAFFKYPVLTTYGKPVEGWLTETLLITFNSNAILSIVLDLLLSTLIRPTYEWFVCVSHDLPLHSLPMARRTSFLHRTSGLDNGWLDGWKNGWMEGWMKIHV